MRAKTYRKLRTLCWVMAVLGVLLLGIGYVIAENWNEGTPSGTESPSLGDDRIRELKRAIRERLATDHVFESVETIPWGELNSTIGMHKHVTLVEQSAYRATYANQMAIFAYDVAGSTELFFRGENDATPIQITEGGVQYIRSEALDPELSNKTLSGATTHTGTMSGGTFEGVTLSGTNTLSGILSGGIFSGNRSMSGTTTHTGTFIGGTFEGVVINNPTITGGSMSGVSMDNQVGSPAIIDGAIQTQDIGDRQVRSQNIATENVQAEHLDSGLVNALPSKGYGFGGTGPLAVIEQGVVIGTSYSTSDGQNIKFRVYVPSSAKKISLTIMGHSNDYTGYVRLYCGGLTSSEVALERVTSEWRNVPNLDVSSLSGWQDLWIQFRRSGDASTFSIDAYSFAWVN